MSSSKQLRANAGSLPPEIFSKKVKPNNFGRSIDVFCRFRPISASEKKSPYYIIDSQDNFVELDAPDEVIQKNSKIKKYTFTQVFDDSANQVDVFDATVKGMVSDLLNSRLSGVIFSYGVTNAGKTHTIIGSRNDPGLLPKLLNYLMGIKESLQKGEPLVDGCDYDNPMDLEVGFESFEIYNEEIFDLNPDPKKVEKNRMMERPKLKVKEGPQHSLIIEELQRVVIATEEEATSVVNKCLKNRQVAATTLNSSSSRSHTIFRVSIDLIVDYLDQHKRVSKRLGHLCVVDLAGSERAKRTENIEGKLKEAGGINNSLMVLGRCFQALKNNSIVPFRDCKLTRLLSEFFKYESKIKMITNINPREDDFIESLRVLNYASLAKEVKFIASSLKSIRMESNLKLKENRQTAHHFSVCTGGDGDASDFGGRAETTYSNHCSLGRKGTMDVENQRYPAPVYSAWDDQPNVDKFVKTMHDMMKSLHDDYKQHTEKMMRQIKNETIVAMLTERVRMREKKLFSSVPNTPSKFSKTELRFEVVPNPQIKPVQVMKDACTMTSKSVDIIPSTRRKVKGPRSALKRSNSDDEENYLRLPVIKINQSKATGESSKKVTMTPQDKKQRSSFYDSLLKQPQLKEHNMLELSKREHEKALKEKYYFLLEVCDYNFDEADKWFRSEVDHTPPKLTSKEKEKLLADNN
jgi:hypothetical protein